MRAEPGPELASERPLALSYQMAAEVQTLSTAGGLQVKEQRLSYAVLQLLNPLARSEKTV